MARSNGRTIRQHSHREFRRANRIDKSNLELFSLDSLFRNSKTKSNRRTVMFHQWLKSANDWKAIIPNRSARFHSIRRLTWKIVGIKSGSFPWKFNVNSKINSKYEFLWYFYRQKKDILINIWETQLFFSFSLAAYSACRHHANGMHVRLRIHLKRVT